MPKLQKDYIDKGKADYQFVNMAFLGKDSVIGSRATHAVENIAPRKSLKFQKLIFSKQPNHENKWITKNLVDKQIDKLNLSTSKANKIKKDMKRYKDKGVKEATTVYVNDKKLKDSYIYKEYKKI